MSILRATLGRMRRLGARRLCAFGALAVVVACTSSPSGTGTRPPRTEGEAREQSPTGTPVALDVDVTTSRQVIDGFGMSERVWDDPHLSGSQGTSVPDDARQAILAALFGDLGLTRLRSVLDDGIEPANDNDDPQRLDASKLNFSGKRTDAHTEVVRQAIPLGLKTFFAAPLDLERWMTTDDPDEYVEWAVAVLLRWKALGVEPPFYSVMNEPALRRRAGSNDWLTTVVARLGARLRQAGLQTRLVIPDDLNPTEALGRAEAVLNDPSARPYVGALAYHLYGGENDGMAKMQELGQRFDLPVWMTELSRPQFGEWPGALDWAVTMHRVLTTGGASAVDYLWGFFGSQEQPHTLIAMDFRDGLFRGYTRGPPYYLTGQFSRFVTPGSVRVEAGSARATVLVSAYRRPDGALVVVTINTAAGEQPVRVSVPRLEMTGDVQVTRTSKSEEGTTLPPLAATPSGFDAALAGRSVTTFVVPVGADRPPSADQRT